MGGGVSVVDVVEFLSVIDARVLGFLCSLVPFTLMVSVQFRYYCQSWWCRESLLVVSVERRAYSDVLELLCLARFFLN